MGLPVIPFAQLILHEREDEAERGKRRRKSTDLKKELSDFRFWNKEVYFEDEEDESPAKSKDTKEHSSMVKYRVIN